MIRLIKPGKKQKKQYLKFICSKCECEWLEESKNINDSKEEEDYILGASALHTWYFMTCPNCYARTGTKTILFLTDDEVDKMEYT